MEEPDDDRPLVTAAQRDRRQFTALYERNVDAVHAYVYRRVDNRAEAEDITSLVFQKALANLDRFEWRGVPFVAWLVRIASNELATRGRRSTINFSPIDDVEALDEDVTAEVDAALTLGRLVRALPNDQRLVIELRFTEDRSIADVATAIGRSEGAVKQLQHRALQTLRAALEDSDV
jgi:RNA polymerase sigma-70 factor (ECF subfamily)